MQNIYLDNAATTALEPEVLECMIDAYQQVFGNPSSNHQFGRKAKTILEGSRKQIARLLNCEAFEIYFTSGGTESANLILHNAVHNLKVKRIISSKIEHQAVLLTLNTLRSQYGTEICFVHHLPDGNIDIDHLEVLLHEPSDTLVSLMMVNNEIGNILAMEQVADLCKKYQAFFYSDCVQSVGHMPVDLRKIQADFITASAHKFHGPKGIGFAFVKKGIPIGPMITGGEQERGVRAGTENIVSILGMEKALTLATTNMEKDNKHLQELKDYFIVQLKKTWPEITFNGNSGFFELSAPHLLSVRFPEMVPMLLFKLDLKGIAASAGSACQSGSEKGSHVLKEILHEEEQKTTTVRFSFSKYNTLYEIDLVMEALKEILRKDKG
ncbi:MAG: cysteine desulfurase family protein [Flavobacteriaceae bacterium]|nr:cysteine desulfurase family protein [Flavobacteriaceae bacterium]